MSNPDGAPWRPGCCFKFKDCCLAARALRVSSLATPAQRKFYRHKRHSGHHLAEAEIGALSRNRTRDRLTTKQLLYQRELPRHDSNLKASALVPSCVATLAYRLYEAQLVCNTSVAEFKPRTKAVHRRSANREYHGWSTASRVLVEAPLAHLVPALIISIVNEAPVVPIDNLRTKRTRERLGRGRKTIFAQIRQDTSQVSSHAAIKANNTDSRISNNGWG